MRRLSIRFAPWRIWDIKSRDEEIDYAQARGIDVPVTKENNYSKLLSAIATAREAGAATELIRDYYFDVASRYQYLSTGYTEAWSYLGNTALIRIGDYYGYLIADGSYMIAPIYSGATQFINGSAAVCDGSEWYIINEGGFKVAVTDKAVDSLSFLNDGNIRISVDGKYGYIGTDMKVPDHLEYDFASNYRNGIAAVEQNGRWALIDTEGNRLTEFVYEDVLMDEYETCVSNGILFLKKDGKYRMFDTSIKQIGDGSYEDAWPFISTNSAAVCIGGKWGFVDQDGNVVIEPQYDNAKSFSSNGLAAVNLDGVWSYINTLEEVMVEGTFEDCKPFSANGIAAVKEEGVWNYIELYSTYYS